MIDRQRLHEIFRANCWRIPFLVLFSIVAASGYFACSLDREYAFLSSASFDGKRFLVECSSITTQDSELFLVEADGDIRCHLTENRNLRTDWTSAGDLILSTNDDVHLLEFSADGRCVSKRATMPVHTNCKFVTASGNAMWVEVSADASAKFVRIFKNEREVKRFGFGSAERAHPTIRVSPRGEICFSICFTQHRHLREPLVEANEEYLITNGVHASTLILDPDSGEEMFRFNGGYWTTNSDRYLMKRNEKNEKEIVAMKDVSRPLATMSSDTSRAIFVDDHLVVACPGGFGLGPGHYVLHDLQSNESRALNIPVGVDLFPAEKGHVYFTGNSENVCKLNLGSGKRRTVFTVRPWYKLKQAIAFVGLPLLCLGWLFVSYRYASFPIIELCLVAALGCLCGVIWLSVAGPTSERLLSNVCTALFQWLVALVVVWGVNTRSLVGHGLPILFFGLAAVLRLFRFHQHSPNYYRTEYCQDATSTAMLFWGMLVGVFVTRQMFGRLQSQGAEPSNTRISIKQCLIVTCAVAAFFAIARLVGIRIDLKLEESVYAFGVFSFIAVFTAYVCGTFTNRLWVAIPLFLLATGCIFAAYEWTVTIDGFRLSNVPTLWETLNSSGEYMHSILGIAIRPCYVVSSAQVLLTAILMFCSMRYCLACAWRPIANRGHDV